METTIGRYFLKQQNHGQRNKKAPIRYLFFFLFQRSLLKRPRSEPSPNGKRSRNDIETNSAIIKEESEVYSTAVFPTNFNSAFFENSTPQNPQEVTTVPTTNQAATAFNSSNQIIQSPEEFSINPQSLVAPSHKGKNF